jgi:hypothetical protein
MQEEIVSFVEVVEEVDLFQLEEMHRHHRLVVLEHLVTEDLDQM